MKNKRIFLWFLFLGLMLILSFFVSIIYGGSRLNLKGVLDALLHPYIKGTAQIIVWQIRFPRIILGLLVGAGLAVCGTVFQGLLRNPLAEPYTLGVSGGAALVTTIGIILALPIIYLPILSFTGGLLSISLVYIIASKKRFSNPTLILGGVILNFLFSSLVLLLFSICKSQYVHSAILWLMGGLSSTQQVLIRIIPFFIIPPMAILFILSRDLNLLSLGEEKARHLGLNPGAIKKLLFIIASLITGACVASTGIIGFVGLIVPHFMRRIVGPNHQLLLPSSCIGGAVFLILSDTLARTIIRPMELPVGVITGIFGGLFFLGFLLKRKRWEL